MKISVITISYNAVNGIERTLLSVIAQKNADFEYIVIDGNSNDGTQNIINQYKSKISVYISEDDTGIYNAMNKGIDHATGDYCIFMNAGDRFASNDVLYQFIKVADGKPEVYNGNTFYMNGNALKWYRRAHKDVSINHFLRSSICHQSSFIKTSLLRKYKYDEKYRMVSDWKFWLQTLCIDKVEYKPINIDVSVFDMSGVTYTQNERGKKERASVIAEMFDKQYLESVSANDTVNRRSVYKEIINKFVRRFWLIYAQLFLKNKFMQSTHLNRNED